MFEASRVGLIALLEIEHPVATIRLCDGGFLNWPSRGTFVSRDPAYGVLGSVDPAGESVGDEAPGGRFSLLPPSPATAVSLARADAQGSPIRMWMAEANPDTGALIGAPELLFVGMIDTVSISLGRSAAEVTIEYVSEAEKLFMINEGTVLSQASHQRAWPGELGLAYATNVPLAVPWGINGPARGSTYYSGGGGGGSIFSPYVQQR
ncbi:hypothetical protein GGQ97_002303 [Sphingomonas kaistensis]|uniref:DUF2163 domain-containing protein n=1 Tax=Sphingomonas kaistensis TaxID=298708 RepID=A0A7X5Y7Z0_9SPHN|nr:hypothetical protein [Sphingomonas kaistensis]NJC06510.1 hypothetical protein [Sphingomonas kaistensis]